MTSKPSIEESKPLELTEDELKLLTKLSVSTDWYIDKITGLEQYKSLGIRTRVLIRDIALEIFSRISIMTTLNSKEMYFYYTPEKIWKSGIEELIEMMALRMFTYASKYIYNEITKMIQVKHYVHDPELNPDHLLPLLNGVYNFKTKKFETHNPEHLITRKINVAYDGKHKNVKPMLKFLNSMSKPEDVHSLIEMWAYCLHPGYPIAKAIMLLGQGSNGKTTFLRILGAFLGESNYTSLRLQQLQSKFLIGDVRYMFANISPDIPSIPIENTSLFKMLTGNDRIMADVKFKSAFQFWNRAKMLFGANKIPPSPYDQTDAWARRWIIIRFPYKFVAKPSNKWEKKAESVDKLIEQLTKPALFTAWLNYLLPVLQKLLARNSFKYEPDLEDIRTEWMSGATIHSRVIREDVVRMEGGELAVSTLYDYYRAQCGNGDHITHKLFNQRVRQEYGGIKTKKMTRQGKTRTFWLDLALKKDYRDGSS